MSNTKPLSDLVKELPPDGQQVVREFIEFLLVKKQKKKGKKLRQDWAGALRDYRDQYTVLELEQKALEWRSEQ